MSCFWQDKVTFLQKNSPLKATLIDKDNEITLELATFCKKSNLK